MSRRPPTDPGTPRPKKGHPVVTVTLLLVGVFVSLSASLAGSDRNSIAQEDKPLGSAGAVVVYVWIVAVLVLLAIVLAARRPRTPAVRAVIVCLAVPVMVAAVVGTVRLNSLPKGFFAQLQQAHRAKLAAAAALERDLAAAAPAACSGAPVEGSSVVPADLRRLVVIDDGGHLYAYDNLKGRGWGPGAVKDLAAVVCLGAETSDTGTCRYGGDRSYRLTSYSRPVRIMAAADGQQISDSTVAGRDSDCRPFVYSNQMLGDETGEHVGADDVLDYVARTLASPAK